MCAREREEKGRGVFLLRWEEREEESAYLPTTLTRELRERGGLKSSRERGANPLCFGKERALENRLLDGKKFSYWMKGRRAPDSVFPSLRTQDQEREKPALSSTQRNMKEESFSISGTWEGGGVGREGTEPARFLVCQTGRGIFAMIWEEGSESGGEWLYYILRAGGKGG